MLMKPGASPHWGTNALDAPRDAPHGLGDRDVFGEIEVVRVALARRLGHGRIAAHGRLEMTACGL